MLIGFGCTKIQINFTKIKEQFHVFEMGIGNLVLFKVHL
jgi:hypothetical protein